MENKKNFYIDGKWVSPKSKEEIKVIDPATEENCAVISLGNKDDVNDLFMAFDWKFIDSVDVVIHNRWGELVFQTNEVDVNWDGTHFKTKEILSDGVYYYTVVAYTRRLRGIVPETFSGNVHLFGDHSFLVE